MLLQSKECQADHWKIHKPVCKPLEAGEVWGIKILDNRYQPWSRQFQHVLLEPSHPVFTQGELCPVTAKCGFPLLIWSEAIHGGLPAMENNQPAVYLRIEPDDGFAPFQCVLQFDRHVLVLTSSNVSWQRTDPGTVSPSQMEPPTRV